MKKKRDSRKRTLQSKGRVKTEAYKDANGNAEFEQQFQRNTKTSPDGLPSIDE